MSNEQKETAAGADEIVQVHREGDVTVVTMNYPERRNAFSMRMRLALTDVFQRLMNDDPDTRAIVLTGAGGHFCAGGDLSEMHGSTPPLLALRERIAVGVRLFKLIYTGTKPVVAAVEGSCYGAGVSLAAACDVVVSADTAKYSCAFGKVGLLPDTGILWTLPQKVGGGKARELMLKGDVIDATTARRIGLVSELSASGHARDAAIAAAARFASYPPVTLALLKASLVNAGNSIEDACRLETDLNPLTRQTSDHVEAVKAFMEKRKPVFTGE
ncbi:MULTISPECIES: enoyl-CoA hydratase/isomerase family protein [Burkholderia]|uniref:Enoyl-CoA hydratase/isomerase n=1 Tax=Burkholderia orbicola (strain MC0-3) TaxID=406425 RepID=B1KCK5_BURO0|nr:MULTISPECIES: enoyl-CoA hydratase/isomerase family protein [Burkholderia]ACA95952.1 Enoyl-CoA hydratase/isomerase [Burkholderia orbicola MC0-3]KWU20850.1 enoyl-CoA hydratase [Burkholderia cenocepacia]MBY4798445.1 enoyl-CoA hydratase/isomerase family protein [Burkholderia cepacia]MCA8088030.1 enoyl-CoA hydratase/isomerase family protein [Burkholderia cenocepacia]RQV54789.1 enoyl-CoA hydratase/isomerase family protein [Burkholderia cenocepacia]